MVKKRFNDFRWFNFRHFDMFNQIWKTILWTENIERWIISWEYQFWWTFWSPLETSFKVLYQLFNLLSSDDDNTQTMTTKSKIRMFSKLSNEAFFGSNCYGSLIKNMLKAFFCKAYKSTFFKQNLSSSLI